MLPADTGILLCVQSPYTCCAVLSCTNRTVLYSNNCQWCLLSPSLSQRPLALR